MPRPMVICIEDLDAAPGSIRYIRCVAVAGGEAGLTLDLQGDVLWRRDEQEACQLWVSMDERLILLRPAGAPVVRVSRAGRSIDAPRGKPVVLLDQDQVQIGGRRLRVHVHGETEEVFPPSPLEPERREGRLAGAARAAATALALGAALGASGCKSENSVDLSNKNIQVRKVPPAPPAKDPLPPPPPDAAAKAGPDLKATPKSLPPSLTPIEVRKHPPGATARPRRRPPPGPPKAR